MMDRLPGFFSYDINASYVSLNFDNNGDQKVIGKYIIMSFSSRPVEPQVWGFEFITVNSLVMVGLLRKKKKIILYKK